MRQTVRFAFSWRASRDCSTKGSVSWSKREASTLQKLIDRAGDPAIPTLAAVLDPTELAKQLSQLSFPQWQWESSQGIQLRVLRWKKASRCTFEIALNTASGSQELIGK